MAVRRVIQTNEQQSQTSASVQARSKDFAALRSVDRNRRVSRAPELLEAVQRLDTSTDPATALAIMKWISEEYESRQGGILLGLFGKCYLGGDFVDHRMDLAGGYILEHFTHAQTPPMPFQAARPYARSSAYAFVEVYDDGAIVPVRPDGRPVV